MSLYWVLRALGVVVPLAAAGSFQLIKECYLSNIKYDWLEPELPKCEGPQRHSAIFAIPNTVDPYDLDGNHEPVQGQPMTYTIVEPADAIPAMSSCGNRKKLVALTFDDGPFATGETDNLRKELAQLGVKATFFLAPHSNGDNEQEQCRVAHLLLKDGHELQLHTLTHPHLPELNKDQIDWQIQGNIDWMERCGLPRARMLRPPFGELLPDQARYIYDTYGTIISLWNVESLDHELDYSKQRVFESVVSNFNRTVGDGNSAVVLMHDVHASRRSGIATQVVEYFRSLDYTFVTMNQCYNACQKTVCKGNGGPSPWTNVYVP